MLILTIRTDKPEAELGLYDNQTKLSYVSWQAHKQLSSTIHNKIADLLSGQSYNLDDVNGIVVYTGPGSFTGLRIGISLSNALAYSLNAPIVGSNGETWLEQGLKRLMSGQSDRLIMPEYGAEPHITVPRK
jgi:tRNA threonylcarbamoyladenosine biosynthesis protein TsaB